jgi:hypothetical protein
MASMLFFLENLVNLPKGNIRNVIKEGTEAFFDTELSRGRSQM